MLKDAPVTVTRRVDARLLLSETCDLTFPTLLRYDVSDPYAVTATFLVGREAEVDWVLARDLLADGLHGRTGDGDVVLGPLTGPGSREVELTLSAPQGVVRLTFPADALATFLEASHQVVPPGSESEFLDIDATIMQLLS